MMKNKIYEKVLAFSLQIKTLKSYLPLVVGQQ